MRTSNGRGRYLRSESRPKRVARARVLATTREYAAARRQSTHPSGRYPPLASAAGRLPCVLAPPTTTHLPLPLVRRRSSLTRNREYRYGVTHLHHTRLQRVHDGYDYNNNNNIIRRMILLWVLLWVLFMNSYRYTLYQLNRYTVAWCTYL